MFKNAISVLFSTFFNFATRIKFVKNFTFFESYFKTVQQIKTNTIVELNKYPVHTRFLRKTQIQLYQFVLVVAVFLFLIRFFTIRQLTDLTNIITYDIFFIENFDVSNNIWLASFCAIAVYFFELMYFNNNGITFLWLYKILIEKVNFHFIDFYIVSTNKINKNKQKFPTTTSKHVVVYFQEKAIQALNLFQIIYYCNIFYFLCSQFRTLNWCIKNNIFDNIFLGTTIYFTFQFFCISTHLIIFIGLKSFTAVGTFGILILHFCFSALRMEDVYFNSFSPSDFSNHLLNKFLCLNEFAIKCLKDVNRLYGPALFVFILFGMPTNAKMVISLLTQRLSPQNKLIIIILALFQLSVIFVIHFFSALITVKLHQPAKTFFKISFASKRIKSIKMKLKLCRYIEQFCSNNTYSVTYGKYGKISYVSIGKV